MTACQSLRPDVRRVYLPGGAVWHLLAPVESGLQETTMYQVTAKFKGKELSMLMQLEVNKQTLSLAALTPTMMSLFTLQDDGDQIKIEQHMFEEGALDPRYVLADIQLTYWPLSTLQASLKGSDLILEDQVVDQVRERMLTDKHHKELVRIRYEQNEDKGIVFTNRAREYEYRIRTVERSEP